MEATAFWSSTLLPSQPFSSSKPPHRRIAQRRSAGKIFAAGRNDAWNWDHDGRVVDDNMIVLRKRIHEKKMMEMNYEPPSNWMEWEKRYYANYDSDICEAMGLLQSLLMSIRPSLALGMVALVAMSVPTSTVMILFHLIEIAKGILAGNYLT